MAQVEDKPVATRTLKNYIGGRWVEAEGTETLDVTNPATGEVLGQVPLSTPDRGRRGRAGRARGLPRLARDAAARAGARLLPVQVPPGRGKDELALLVTTDNGKTIKDATGEIGRGIECVEVATGIPSLMQGSNLEDVSRGIDSDMIRQPIGVFAAITPFNFPFMVPMWFLPYAIACGNTFVLKPSEQVPLASERTFELLDEAGLPPGVVNLVNGGKESVDAILQHPEVDGVSFVGSTPVARYIYEAGAKNGKRVQALGGAKNHVIVMPDADLDTAVDGVLSSAFHAAGQRCLANSVCIAVGEIYEPLRAALAEKGEAMVVDVGSNPDAEVGPVISSASQERILGWIDKGVEQGGELVLDGRGRGSEDGNFIGPTIIESRAGRRDRPRGDLRPRPDAAPRGGHRRGARDPQLVLQGNAASIFTTSGGAMRASGTTRRRG